MAGVAGFNPLHCGAVVASMDDDPIFVIGSGVSIPFIAGQWSLQMSTLKDPTKASDVSIPFIAGQWSLPEAEERARKEEAVFQSPSLRGSGRFRRIRSGRKRRRGKFQSPSLRGSGRFIWIGRGPPATSCFNPLHCGAVVASGKEKKK